MTQQSENVLNKLRGNPINDISQRNYRKLRLTRPNRSTRSEDYTQMTTLLNQKEHNDSV